MHSAGHSGWFSDRLQPALELRQYGFIVVRLDRAVVRSFAGHVPLTVFLSVSLMTSYLSHVYSCGGTNKRRMERGELMV